MDFLLLLRFLQVYVRGPIVCPINAHVIAARAIAPARKYLGVFQRQFVSHSIAVFHNLCFGPMKATKIRAVSFGEVVHGLLASWAHVRAYFLRTVVTKQMTTARVETRRAGLSITTQARFHPRFECADRFERDHTDA